LEDEHLYLLQGRILPSVTQILKDEKYNNIPRFILEKAAYKGTQVHKATENYDLGNEVYLEQAYEPYLSAYIDFRLENDIPILERETMVYTEDYAGTIDFVGKVDDKILIADIKTTSKLYTESVAMQLAAYVIAHSYNNDNQLEDYKGAVIWLKKDGKYEYHEIDPDFNGFNKKLIEYKNLLTATSENNGFAE